MVLLEDSEYIQSLFSRRRADLRRIRPRSLSLAHRMSYSSVRDSSGFTLCLIVPDIASSFLVCPTQYPSPKLCSCVVLLATPSTSLPADDKRLYTRPTGMKVGGGVDALNERRVNDVGEYDNKGDDTVLTEGFIAAVDTIPSGLFDAALSATFDTAIFASCCMLPPLSVRVPTRSW